MAGKVKALMMWCQKHTAGYRDVNVVNMTTSWRNGMAFCALIHRFRPDLIDFDSLSKENVLHNNQLAFQVAERELGIAALLDADDMVAMKVPDKLSIITYVSQYYNSLHNMKPVASPSKPVADKQPQKRSALPVTPLEQVEVKKKPITHVESATLPERRQEAFILCEICKKKVHLVERYIDEGKIYHRQCHRTKSLSGMYQRNDARTQSQSLVKPSISSQNKADAGAANNGEPKKTVARTRAETVQHTPSISKYSSPNNSGKLGSRIQSLVGAFDSSMKQQKDPEVKTNVDGGKLPNGLNDKKNLKKIDNGKSIPSNKESQKNMDTSSEIPVVLIKSDQSKDDNDSGIGDKLKKETVPVVKLENKIPSVDVGTKEFSGAVSTPNSKQNFGELKHNDNEITKTVERTAETDRNDKNEDEETSMLPALLESLAGSKTIENKDSQKSLPTLNQDLTVSAGISPLISELPKAPEAKPRNRSGSSIAEASKTTKSSGDSNQPAKGLNPFESFEDGEEFDANDNDGSLNPFDIDLSDISNKKPTPAPAPTNPFGDEEDEVKDSSAHQQKINTQKGHTSNATPERLRVGTVNITSSNDVRLNPFTDAYEDKKLSVPAPVPPRRKAHSPAPPRVSVNKESSTKSTSSPSKRNAPKWKANVEQKMAQMNEVNDKDSKFIEKTPESKVTSSESPKPNRSAPSKATPDQPKVKSSKKLKPSRPAPGFGFPLVKRRVKSQMTEEEISNEMTILDIQLKDLEKKGVKVEEVLREDMEIGLEGKTDTEQLMGEWFDLVQEKNKLVRRETDLVYLMQQQRLEQEHADVEFNIRKLMNKPDSEKTEAEKEEEAHLLEKLVKVVERRNTIINSIEEARVKEEEEDAAYDRLKSMHGDVAGESDSAKKKKTTIKKIFSRRKKTPKSSKRDSSPTSPS